MPRDVMPGRMRRKCWRTPSTGCSVSRARRPRCSANTSWCSLVTKLPWRLISQPCSRSSRSAAAAPDGGECGAQRAHHPSQLAFARQLREAQRGEHRPAIDDIEIVRDRRRPASAVGPWREQRHRSPAGAVDDRLAQLRGRARDDRLGNETLLYQHVFGGGNPAEPIARAGALLRGPGRDFAESPQDRACDLHDGVPAFDVPVVGSARAQILDAAPRIPLRDFEADDIAAVLDFGAARQVDQEVETVTFQWTEGVAIWECDHACSEYTAVS